MPYAPLSYCRQKNPQCVHKATRQGFCEAHYLERKRAWDKKRGNGSARGWTTEWAAFRTRYLAEHPRCECAECMGLAYGLRPIATDINHLGDASRTSPDRYDESKLMAMSHAHHSRYTAQHQPGGWHKPQ